MPETMPHPLCPPAPLRLRLDRYHRRTGCATSIRNRIGVDLAGGFYPAPHRYRLYLSAECPDSLRVAITLDLLGLRDSLPTTVLAPDGPEASTALRGYYEATRHRFDGPLTVPALCDHWSGHIVSNHTPDILRDLADHLGPESGGLLPRLRPAALASQIDDLREYLAREMSVSEHHDATSLDRRRKALALLDRRLASGPYIIGTELTAADIDLWVTLVDPRLTDAVRDHERLVAYVRRLHRVPAFRANHTVPVPQGAAAVGRIG